jgi:hypothetical protein
MTTRPKSFLDKATEGRGGQIQEHFRTTWPEKVQLHTHILQQHRSVSDWLREAVAEKMARELEAAMNAKASEPEAPGSVRDLLLRRK